MAIEFKASASAGGQHAVSDEIQMPPNSDAVIDQLRALVGSNYLNTEPSLVQIRASALFSRLKTLNRASNSAMRSRKQATGEARNEMDQTHLGLQNLQYEKRHLEREIEKCRQFGSIYQDIPLHSLEEFLELAPEALHTAEVIENEHQLMLNRLSFELSERQRLEQKRKELTQQKEELLKESKAKVTTIDSVKAQIDILMKTASEIQKKVDEMVQPSSTATTLSTEQEHLRGVLIYQESLETGRSLRSRHTTEEYSAVVDAG